MLVSLGIPILSEIRRPGLDLVYKALQCFHYYSRGPYVRSTYNTCRISTLNKGHFGLSTRFEWSNSSDRAGLMHCMTR